VVGQEPMAHGLSAIVLCGGRSRRMGTEKALLRLDGATIAARVVALIRPWVDDIVLAARADQTGLPDAPRVNDLADDRGPLPAVMAALPFTGQERSLIVAVDTPLLMPELIPMLHQRMGDADVAVPWVGGHPVMALSVVSRAAVTRAEPLMRDGAGLRDLLPLLRVVQVSEDDVREIDPELRSFLPCNTPEDFDTIRSLYLRDRSGRQGDAR